MGCLAALSRFISRLGEKGLPFFKLLKASEHFMWTEEVDKAFAEPKLFLTSPPIMIAPQPNETLSIYITATSRVVSTAVVIEREEAGHAYKVQRPIYFISKVLNKSKTRYPQVQKLLYAVLITSRKLRHYFDTYKITVVTEFPFGDILRNKEANGPSLNGWSSSALTPSNSEVDQLSSRRYMQISSSSGQRSKNLSR
jgi:hypothetical protein